MERSGTGRSSCTGFCKRHANAVLLFRLATSSLLWAYLYYRYYAKPAPSPFKLGPRFN